MMRSFSLCLLVLARFATSAPLAHRFLEDVEDGDNYDGDLSQFTLQQGQCFRMKIAGDNDDDGNSYFYNGAYRAQYTRYISYYMCTSSGTCSQYVSVLEDYLDETVGYVQNLCNSCTAQCRRNRLRQLEDEEENDDAEEEEQITANCDTCANQCKLLNSDKANSGTDESGYLECLAGNEEDGIQYYTAPQCENGLVVIGHFYDDECSIKTTTLQDGGFSYNTFQTIANLYIDCSEAGSTCANLFANAVFCDEGYSGDQDDSHLCKAAAAAGRVYTYYKKPFYKKVPLGFIFFLVFSMGFGIGFLTYTYYVRHRRIKIPLAKLDETDLPDLS